MKICSLKLMILIFITLNFSFVQGNVHATSQNEITSWTWSEEIIPGNYYWEIVSFQYLGNSVTQKMDKTDLIEGSVIKLEVTEEMHGIEFYNVDPSFELPITIYFDEVVVEKHNFYPIEFIYPSLVGWSNNTYDNLFLLDRPENQDILNFSNYSRIEGDYYIIEEFNQEVRYFSSREISSGILYSWKVEYPTSKLEYAFLRYESNMQDVDVNVNTLIILASGFIALVLIMLRFSSKYRF